MDKIAALDNAEQDSGQFSGIYKPTKKSRNHAGTNDTSFI